MVKIKFPKRGIRKNQGLASRVLFIYAYMCWNMYVNRYSRTWSLNNAHNGPRCETEGRKPSELISAEYLGTVRTVYL